MRDLIRALSPHAWAAVAVGAASAVIILVVVVLSWGQSRYDAGFEAADAARLRANAEALTVDRAATTTAADERLSDARTTSILKEDLTDAVSSLPDARPSDRRVALNCQRLRQQGTDTATIPACVRLAGRAQAAAGPG